MAGYDIMPFQGPHGGHEVIEEYGFTAAETFVVGEPVSLRTTGRVDEAPDNPSAAALYGIALNPGVTGGTGSATAQLNPATNLAYAAGDAIQVVVPTPTQTFITPNFSTDGANFSVRGSTVGANIPAVEADIGDALGLTLIAGIWGLDQAAGNDTCRIVRVLDIDKRDVRLANAGVGTHVVFKIVHHMSLGFLAADDVPAPV